MAKDTGGSVLSAVLVFGGWGPDAYDLASQYA